MNKPDIEIIKTPAQLVQLEEQWNKLVTTSSLPFQTFGWNQSLLKLLPKVDSGLTAFALTDDNDQLLAVLPCRVKEARLELLSDSYGTRGDIVTKDHEAAQHILKFALKFARENKLEARFDGLSQESFLYKAFEKLNAQDDHMMLVSKDKSFDVIEIQSEVAQPEIANEDEYEFQVQEKLKISRNLLLEISQFHDTHAQLRKNNSPFLCEDFIPFLNFLRSRDKVGLTLTTLRNADRDLLYFNLGFRRGRNYYLLFTLFDSKLCSKKEKTLLQIKQLQYLAKKGVRQFHCLSKTPQSLPTSIAPSQSFDSYRCVSYAATTTQKAAFRLFQSQNDAIEIWNDKTPLIAIRLRLFREATGKKLSHLGNLIHDFFNASSSRIKDRRSSST